MKELLKVGADTKVKNNAGNTAFEESLESDNSAELLSVLDSANPKPRKCRYCFVILFSKSILLVQCHYGR